MILERIKPSLDTPDKITEAYAVFSSWLFSNFFFFFVVFYAIYVSYRTGSQLGSISFLIIVFVAMALMYVTRNLVRNLLMKQSVQVNHLVFYVLCIMNIGLLVWIVTMALS